MKMDIRPSRPFLVCYYFRAHVDPVAVNMSMSICQEHAHYPPTHTLEESCLREGPTWAFWFLSKPPTLTFDKTYPTPWAGAPATGVWPPKSKSMSMSTSTTNQWLSKNLFINYHVVNPLWGCASCPPVSVTRVCVGIDPPVSYLIVPPLVHPAGSKRGYTMDDRWNAKRAFHIKQRCVISKVVACCAWCGSEQTPHKTHSSSCQLSNTLSRYGILNPVNSNHKWKVVCRPVQKHKVHVDKCVSLVKSTNVETGCVPIHVECYPDRSWAYDDCMLCMMTIIKSGVSGARWLCKTP